MAFILTKILFAFLLSIEIVAGTPIGFDNFSPNSPASSTSSSSGLFKSFFSPVKKVQHYVGNLFLPTHPNNKDGIHSKHIEPFDNYSGNKQIVQEATLTSKSSIVYSYQEQTTKRNVANSMTIDKEILDKIFNNYKEIDENGLTTIADIERTTGTGDYETTTDNFLRIPAPVVATLLGR